MTPGSAKPAPRIIAAQRCTASSLASVRPVCDAGTMLNGAILAHAGGWDEIAMVAAPIAIFGGLLWMANRRAIRQAEERETAARAAEEETTEAP